MPLWDMRTKGGPNKSMIKRSERFARIRLNNAEWAGCAKMRSAMRHALGGAKGMADFPVIGYMNAIAKKIKTPLWVKNPETWLVRIEK